MKTSYNIKALCMMALMGCVTTAGAQEDKKKEKDLNREMTLEREYDPTVQDASKVNTLPVIKEPVAKKMAIDYASFTIPTEPEKEISLLPSGNVMTNIPYNKRRGYFNFGGGSYLNLNGDLGYHILSTDKDKLNIWFSHRSTNGKVKYLQAYVPEENEKVKAKINDNIGGLNFNHLFRRAILDMGLKYSYSTYNYYGLPLKGFTANKGVLAWDLADRETNQADQTVNAHVAVRSVENAPLGFLFGLNFTNFSHKYADQKAYDGVKENTFKLDFDLFAPFGGNLKIGVTGDLRYYNYSLPTVFSSRSVTATAQEGTTTTVASYENHFNGLLNPYFLAEGDNWHVKLGAKVMMVAGLDYWDNGKFYASPDIAADITIADKTVLYAKAGGELRNNSMYEINQLNRYASPVYATMPSFNWLDAKAGIQCGAAAGFWFDIFAGYQATSNDFYFMTYNPIMQNQFNYLKTRNDIDSKRFYAGADLRYSYQQVVDVRLKGVYNNWKMKLGDYYTGGEINAEIDPIGKPEMELTAGITLHPIKQVSASLDYYLATGRKAEVFGVTQKIDNINELNLTGAYTLNDTFGLYLKLHNVLFQKYELYYGYPMQQFSAMIGVNINF